MPNRATRTNAQPGVRRTFARLLRAMLLIMAAASLTFESARSSSPVLASTMIISVTLLAMYLFRPGDRSFRIWAVYILGFILFIHLRDLADRTGNPTRFDYVINADQILFMGVVPTVWLQQHFAASGWLILFAAGMYASYFLAPHGVALALWRRRPKHFQRYVVAFLATCFVSLVLHFLLPTAPPWLAGQLGYLPHALRLTDDIGRHLGPFAYQQGSAIADSNPVAAMPSLHMALTALIPIAAWRTGNRWRILGLLYAGAMLFSVIFLGEHYFTDALVGIVAALLAWKLACVWSPYRLRDRREKQVVSARSID